MIVQLYPVTSQAVAHWILMKIISPKLLILDHMAISSKDDSCDVNYHNHEPMRTNSDPEDSYYPQYFKV